MTPKRRPIARILYTRLGLSGRFSQWGISMALFEHGATANLAGGIAVLICCAFVAWPIAGRTQDFALPRPPVPIRNMQVSAYTPMFAKRFNLPELEPSQQVQPPLQALRFFIELQNTDPVLNTPIYVCTLQAYFDSSLDVAYPASSKTWTRDVYAPWKQRWLDNKPGPNRLPDQIRIAEQEMSAHESVALASANYSWDKPGVFGTHLVQAFDREFVPGMAYYEIGLLCPKTKTIQSGLPLELWIKKAGTPDFTTQKIDFRAFHKFPIPKSFFARAEPWLAWHEDRVRKAGAEHARISREQRSGRK